MRRGANVELTREIPSLRTAILGVQVATGAEASLLDNLVVATILTDARSRALSDEHFVFFNQLSSPEESVTQRQQALGDDLEQVEVSLADVPAEVERIVVLLYLNEGIVQRRSLAQLREIRIRVVNTADNAELVRSENLVPSSLEVSAVTLGELYRHAGGWKFKVLGEGYTDGVLGAAKDFGVGL
ncbi:MAG TPA: TerD family protein [Jatrophihabitans sp.]|nr:TerD family protein [Jatrophihabitans sp.]